MTNKEIDEIFDLLAEAQDLLEKYKYLDEDMLTKSLVYNNVER